MRPLPPLVALLLSCALLALPQAALGADTPKSKTLYRDGPSGRHLLAGAWWGRADPSDAGERLGYQGDSSLAGWSLTRVPGAVNAQDFSIPSYLGTVHWFRKEFRLPKAARGSKWLLRFESVNYRAKVWLNGKLIGFHVGAYLPFELNATSVRRRGINRLVVKVDSRRTMTDIPPLFVHSTGAFEGGWWNYTGILREVYLRRVTNFDLRNVFVRPRLGCRRCAAKLVIQASVANVNGHVRRAKVAGTIAGRAFRLHGRRVPGRRSVRFTARLQIKHPRLWSPDHPHLYSVRLTAVDASGLIVQRYVVHVGIRSLRVNRRGRVELNFREINLRGASIHEDNPLVGAAIGQPEMRRAANELRRLGATMTRAHYPLHPYFLELCDRKGIVVWSEIPVYRMRTAQFSHATVRAKAVRMLREEILNDRNHPSIMVWSIGNENPSRPKSNFKAYIRKAARTAHSLDPTRLVGIATSSGPTVEKQRIYNELDVLGINDYFGWYRGPRGVIADQAKLSGYLNRLHSDYPRHALFITEFGAEASRSGPVSEKGTYEFQTDFLKYHLSVFASKPFVNGALIWALRDFRVKPGWEGGNPFPNPPLNQKGLLDDAAHPKPAFSVVRRIYRKTRLYR
jgi:beta-glucuronidase